MKLTTLILILATLQISAALHSQDASLKLNFQTGTLSDLIQAIETQSDFRIFYKTDQVDVHKSVSLQETDGTIAELLYDALEGSDISYQVLDRLIVLTSANTNLQQIKISGTVTDASTGEPLPGVNIQIEGTQLGAVTDVSGKYSIQVPGSASVLVFSYVGYIAKRVEVGSQTIIDISLVTDFTTLDEVVVIGYGSQKRSDLTGSVVSVKSEDFRGQSGNSINQLLQGKASGVTITQYEGKPGDGAEIVIRGAGSINGVAPLYIVDGIRGPVDNQLNTNDIESIEILKDAAAAAIFGAEAAHGVVLITTKHGKQSKPVVNLNLNYGQRKAIGLPDMLNVRDYINKRREAWLNDDPARVIDPSFSASNPDWPDTDWKSVMFGGSGIEQGVNLSVSGGTDKLTYFISSNYKREEGILVDNWFERYGIRVNTELQVNDWMKIGENLMIARRTDNPSEDEGRDLLKIFRAVPTMNPYDETNPLGGWGRTPIYFEGGNPLASQYQKYQRNFNNGYNGSLYTELEPIKSLKIRATLGFDISSADYTRFEEAYDWGAIKNPEAKLTKDFRNFETYTGTITAAYDRMFGRHEIGLLVGYEALKGDDRGLNASRTGFPPLSGVNSYNLGVTSDYLVSGGPGMNRLLSQFGRLNYSYAGKYLLQANIRRDGNHKFGPDNKWGIFPSVSAGWRISEEDFMKGFGAISNLKLRASYGTLGSDAAIAAYLYSTTYTSNQVHYYYTQDGSDTDGGYSAYNMPNNAIKWEEVVIGNIALDFGLFRNKLSGTVEYYSKSTNDMIYNINIPLAIGIGAINDSPQNVPTNIGQMKNTGVDINLLFQNNLGDLKYEIGGNASFNKNEITKLYSTSSVLNDGGAEYMDGNICRTELGQPMGYYYGYIVEGLFENAAQVAEYNARGEDGPYQETATQEGDFIYKDIASFNGEGDRVMTPDGKINDADKEYLGNPWPKLTYGLNLSARYKGFDLALVFQGVSGVDLYHATKTAKRGFKGDYNSTSDIFEAWTPENHTNHPRLTANDPNGNMRKHSSYFVENGAYLKLRNLQVGYNLPDNIANAVKMQHVRVYFNAQNLFTITKYTGMDPELGGGVRTRGIEGMDLYPKTRLFSFGLDVTF